MIPASRYELTGPSLRILWLKTELLHPLDKGGKIRTYGMLRELARHHRITYLCLDDGSGGDGAADRASEYCDELLTVPFRPAPKSGAGFWADLVAAGLSSLPYFVRRYRSEAMAEAVRERLRAQDIDVVVCDFLTPSVNLPQELTCPSILFQHNVEALIWRRHAQVQRNPAKRAYLASQWRKTVRYERDACRRFDRVVAVSEDDAVRLKENYGLARVGIVPTGVDTEYFRPRRGTRPGPRMLVFTGSMDWLPNQDAVDYFLNEILPSVRERVPEAKLTVVGRNPSDRLMRRAELQTGLRVTGRVEDVRPFVEEAAVFVLPLRIGGGTRLKVYEALAMEKPMVTTTIGVEGLPVRDGEHVRVADDAEAFADAVVDLLNAPAEARALGERAARWVRANFGWEVAAASFAALCSDIVEREPGRSVPEAAR